MQAQLPAITGQLPATSSSVPGDLTSSQATAAPGTRWTHKHAGKTLFTSNRISESNWLKLSWLVQASASPGPGVFPGLHRGSRAGY